nr:MAG TPA: hypothetical protein [Bacteriophage sp.]
MSYSASNPSITHLYSTTIRGKNQPYSYRIRIEKDP